MKNWKTTLCGSLAALGTYLATVEEPSWVPTVGKSMIVAGTVLLGWFAKDKNVTGGTTPQA